MTRPMVLWYFAGDGRLPTAVLEGAMKKTMVLLSVAAILGMSGCRITGSSPEGGMSLSSFRGNCLTTTSGGKRSDCETNDICNAFSAALSIETASLGSCLDTCQAQYKQQSAGNFMNNCASMVGAARRKCIQYCRSNFQE